MRRSAEYILGLLLIILPAQIFAQDVHFSQIHATPLFNNPAMTGLINGDVRAAAIYRNFTVGQGSGYQTVIGSFDAKLLNVTGDDDWLSGGLMVYHDQAGALNFSTNSFDLAVAYNAGLGGSGHFLSVGLEAGMQQKSLDLGEAQFGNQYNGVDFDAGMASNETLMNQQIWTPKVAAGVMYYYLANSRSYMYAGASAFHINAATSSFTGVVEEAEKMKIQFTLGGSFRLNNQLDLVPSLYSAYQEIYSQMNVGTSLRYVLSNSGDYSAVSIGPYARFTDFMQTPRMEAIILAGRIEWQNITVGMSYDYTTTAQHSANNAGAVEFSLVYELNSGRTGGNNRGRGGSTNCPRF